MNDQQAIPLSVIKIVMPSMVIGILPFWLLPAFGMDVRVDKYAGLVLGAGILLLSIAFGFGAKLKWWVIAPLAVVGSFLFVVAGTALIH